MQAVIALAEELQIPQKAVEVLQGLVKRLPWNELKDEIKAIQCPKTGAQAVKNIEEITKPYAENGLEQLCVYLAAAVEARGVYEERGISNKIFIDTMLCFTRFMGETYEMKGIYGFDRGFWTWRELSCTLFRLGCLEYEYLLLEKDIIGADGEKYCAGEHVISVHIPSGAALSQQEMNASYAMAKSFFMDGKNITGYSDKPRVFFCSTWLLSPELTALCSENSGIRRFAQMFSLYETNKDDNMFKAWLFGAKDETPVSELCEKTSLQKAVKQHLQNGGLIGTAAGLIKLEGISL